MDQPTLYCFYDLEVSPPSYDFFTYMQLAELHRKRYNLSNLFFIFVPGPKDGFRNDNLSKTTAQRYMMMRNVVIPSCRLLSSHIGTICLPNRNEAEGFYQKTNGNVFPWLYSPEQPKADYLWNGIVAAYLRNETFTTLREPPEYQRMVSSLFPDDGVRKLITVTIREAPYNTARNTNFQAWLSFLKTLDTSKYKIVIIPDTNNLSNDVFEGFEYCKIASINVLFRTAIYRKAYLNMFHNNGPANAAIFSNSPLLCIQKVETDGVSTTPWFHGVVAIDPDEHHQHAMLKRNQRLVWGPDTVDVLVEAFNTYVEDFPEKPILPVEEHGFQSDFHKQLACRSAFGYMTERFSMPQLKREDIDTLKMMVNLMPNFIDPIYTLAIIASKYGKLNTVIQLFDGCINLLETKYHVYSDSSKTALYKTLCQSKAEAFEKANRLDETLNEYIKINERCPNDNHILEKIASLRKN